MSKIIHIVPSYKPAFVYGGPIKSVSFLCESLARNSIDVQVLTTDANGNKNLICEINKQVQIDGVNIIYFHRITGDHTHISFGLWKYVLKHVKKNTIVHIHSWWNPLVIIAAWIAVMKKATIIISPRGMLSEYSQKKNKLFKQILQNIFGRVVFNKAFIHATSKLESLECTQWIDKNRIFNIPNLVEFASNNARKDINEESLFTLVYLSRLESKKGLELLFLALSKVSFPYSLHIAGDGEEEYKNKLVQLAKTLGIANNINWYGWMDGTSKFTFLSKFNLFVLPSFNENFANVVIEALAVGTPVLVSNQVGLYDIVTQYDLGWVCEANVESLMTKLIEAYQEIHKRNRISQSSPEIIKEIFSEETLIKKYVEMYNTLAHV